MGDDYDEELYDTISAKLTGEDAENAFETVEFVE